VNRLLCRRGHVWSDRFHSRMLRTPREVRNALVYVLNNFRKHVRSARGFDPCSSARWFDGWRGVRPMTTEKPMVAAARTWLAHAGWRLRLPLIGLAESPRR
jgi:hypothetical protein